MTTTTAVETAGTKHHLRPSSRMHEKFLRELAAIGMTTHPRERLVVTESDLERLPHAAQRYMRFMRVLERPRDTSFRAHSTSLASSTCE
jgi:hypothetical protein